MKNPLLVIAAVLPLILLSAACTPFSLAAGAGATVGVAAAEEGGIKGAATDTAIRLKITDLWLDHDAQMYTRLSLTVKEGRVLIAGSVKKPQQRVDAVRLAWQANGVRQVINEIRVEDKSFLSNIVTDSWITSNIETRLLLDKHIQSINYTVETTNGTVYLIGVAQDRKELQRVLDYARNTKSVKNVVSYVRLRGETPVGVQETPTGVNDGWLAESADSAAPVRQQNYAGNASRRRNINAPAFNNEFDDLPPVPASVQSEPLN
jgi:osmotically-inducible protein OsmY